MAPAQNNQQTVSGAMRRGRSGIGIQENCFVGKLNQF